MLLASVHIELGNGTLAGLLSFVLLLGSKNTGRCRHTHDTVLEGGQLGGTADRDRQV